MAKRVEFQYKNKEIKRLSRAMARSLEKKGQGRIIGDIKTAREIESLEEARVELEQSFDDKLVAYKKESESNVAKAEAKTVKVEKDAKAKEDKNSKAITDMKAELAKSKKELAASLKMQKATQNKLDKAVLQRATK